ncbi:ArnT family glycosyltransferase [Paraburkholderia phenazinium]|uniref:ArnT family glycosyltransferase n=1 Tax=Paraburkholderia phenazinium TaxID=60549 RepID=UPI0009415134|nr:glycosyltransferase family 87 protein [Paraburkholderia phenazinium]
MQASNRAKVSIVAILASALFGALVAYTFVGLVRYAMVAPPSFDGAMNLNTAASFSRGEGYGFFYDQFFSFPAQTDGPFILPAALAFWVGGITPFTSQVVNLLYVVALICMVIALTRRVGVPLWLALFGMMACVATPGFIEYSMSGYGEIPVLVWFLAGIFVLVPRKVRGIPDRHRLFVAGLLFGMAYLTKVVALVCVAPGMLVLACLIFTQPNRWRRLVAFAIGFGAPVAAWEVFRLVELGSVHAYLGWWRFQAGQILAQSGARPNHAAEGVIHKGVQHLSILADLTGVAAPMLAICVVVPVALGLIFALDRRRLAHIRLVLGMLAVVVGLYFFWWIFIGPTAMAWLRRIVDGLVLLQCLIVVVLAEAWRRPDATPERSVARGRGLRAVTLLALVPVVAGQLFLIRSGETITHPPQPPKYALDMFQMADRVRALPPDATVFGTGWWQAPVVALFSQRRFMNFEHWSAARINALRDKYFVTDMYTEGLSQKSIRTVLDESQHTVLFKLDGGALYKLWDVQPYVPFAPEDSDTANLAREVDFSSGDYSSKRGIFKRDGDPQAWVSPDGAIMLKRSNESSLRMVIEVPRDLFTGAAPQHALLHASSPGCLDQVLSLDKAGVQTLSLPLTCAASPEVKPFRVNLTVDDHVPFVPQIDADNRPRSFKLRSIGLIETAGTL